MVENRICNKNESGIQVPYSSRGVGARTGDGKMQLEDGTDSKVKGSFYEKRVTIEAAIENYFQPSLWTHFTVSPSRDVGPGGTEGGIPSWLFLKRINI